MKSALKCNAGHYWCKSEAVVHSDGDKRFCVFHAPREHKGVSVRKFNQLIFQRLDHTALEKDAQCDLSGTVFAGDIDFSHKKLPSINVISAKFGENADFSSATFGKNAWFIMAKFGENANFREAKFNGNIELGAKLKKAHFMGNTFLDTANFKGLTVEDEVRFKGVNFKGVFLDGAEMDRMRFEHCTWDDATNKGRITIRDESELNKDNKDESGLKKNKDEKIKQVEELYRTLKQKYKEMHNEGMASLFHVSEKLMLTRRTRFRDKPFDWVLLNLYNLSSGYGENPRQALTTLFILIFMVFTLVGSVGLVPREKIDTPNTIYMSKYGPFEVPSAHTTSKQDIGTVFDTTVDYLLIVFYKTTYHDLNPASSGGWVSIRVVILLIYIQTLLFIFALRNKMRR